MLTKEELNPKLYPRECWINVYQYDVMDQCYVTGDMKFSSKQAAFSYIPSRGLRLAYMIHVRLKQ